MDFARHKCSHDYESAGNLNRAVLAPNRQYNGYKAAKEVATITATSTDSIAIVTDVPGYLGGAGQGLPIRPVWHPNSGAGRPALGPPPSPRTPPARGALPNLAVPAKA